MDLTCLELHQKLMYNSVPLYEHINSPLDHFKKNVNYILNGDCQQKFDGYLYFLRNKIEPGYNIKETCFNDISEWKNFFVTSVAFAVAFRFYNYRDNKVLSAVLNAEESEINIILIKIIVMKILLNREIFTQETLTLILARAHKYLTMDIIESLSLIKKVVRRLENKALVVQRGHIDAILQHVTKESIIILKYIALEAPETLDCAAVLEWTKRDIGIANAYEIAAGLASRAENLEVIFASGIVESAVEEITGMNGTNLDQAMLLLAVIARHNRDPALFRIPGLTDIFIQMVAGSGYGGFGVILEGMLLLTMDGVLDFDEDNDAATFLAEFSDNPPEFCEHRFLKLRINPNNKLDDLAISILAIMEKSTE